MERKVADFSVGDTSPETEAHVQDAFGEQEFHSLSGLQGLVKQTRRLRQIRKNNDAKLRHSNFILGESGGTECFCPQGRLCM